MPPADVSPSRSPISRCSGTPLTTCMSREGRSRLIFGEDERVANWCRERLPDFLGWNGYYVAIGYERASQLAGGVVFTQFSGANIVLAAVLEAPLTRMFLRAMFFYPFLQLEVRRITVLIDEDNAKSIRLVEHVGFEKEGRMRNATAKGDVLIYGLLKERCQWL